MAWFPISNLVPQYVDPDTNAPHSGAVLKAYDVGTTDNVPFATDNTGDTTVNSVALNASGHPEVSGNVIIPHLDRDYKLALYPDQTAADADSGALWTVDDIDLVDDRSLVTSVAIYSDLKGLDPDDFSDGDAIYVRGSASVGDGLEGHFKWTSGDQSTNVTNDPNEIIWVAPNSDTDGSSGAWRRLGLNDVVDPEHATDSATDTYVSATNTTPPADGVKITRDFQSANTTTAPTLDGKTMTTRDGSALWASAIDGVHELEYDGTDYLLLHPTPSPQQNPTRSASTTQSGIVERATSAEVAAGTNTALYVTPFTTAQNYLQRAATSSDPALAFDSWRTPNADRPTLIIVRVQVQTNGTVVGTVHLDVDEGGGTTADYNFRALADSDLASGSDIDQTLTAFIPAGGSYQIRNSSDPNTANSINEHREFTL